MFKSDVRELCTLTLLSCQPVPPAPLFLSCDLLYLYLDSFRVVHASRPNLKASTASTITTTMPSFASGEPSPDHRSARSLERLSQSAICLLALSRAACFVQGPKTHHSCALLIPQQT
ncbi:hypothetical protein M378DRAFT_794422 [Amanita muscaria Koide BX008]|uniref:Uncharacterized protein n=1 Tax=Amanita muscaria (strain Koide BX008) TaxID=946122 RepID=A0A0C2RWA5_AMAMK|nr:hypothetical protein M378DRAFT_794422 [Amanita muscaria Koide BX008]